MAYRFKTSESIESAVKRVAAEQLDRAAAELTDQDLDTVEAIHQARKRFKKLRALLRLLRPLLGESAFKKYNHLFRDLGRDLSASRDADVLLETLDDLERHLSGSGEAADLAGLRQWLIAGRKRSGDPSQDLRATMAEIATQLRSVREQIEAWSIDTRGRAAPGPGLKQIYAKGRKAMKLAIASPSDANYHEWRKRVKDHWYHTRLLTNAWPPLMKARATEMKRLSDLLGDDHDLAVFRRSLAEVPSECLSDADREMLLRLIMDRQRTLREQASGVGLHAYAEKPKHFKKRMQAWWDASISS